MLPAQRRSEERERDMHIYKYTYTREEEGALRPGTITLA